MPQSAHQSNAPWVYARWGKGIYYYFVSDSNKFPAVATAVSAFLFFNNLALGYHPVINRIAASAFGILMIHANSDTMRQWLLKDLLNNVSAYHSSNFILHAVGSVFGIYVVCTLIDMIRIRFLEKPLFRQYDRIKGYVMCDFIKNMLFFVIAMQTWSRGFAFMFIKYEK